MSISWWRHQMEVFSALVALCAGNSPVTAKFPAQRASNVDFDVSLMWAAYAVKQTIEWPMIWDYMTFKWRHRNYSVRYMNKNADFDTVVYNMSHKIFTWFCRALFWGGDIVTLCVPNGHEYRREWNRYQRVRHLFSRARVNFQVSWHVITNVAQSIVSSSPERKHTTWGTMCKIVFLFIIYGLIMPCRVKNRS